MGRRGAEKQKANNTEGKVCNASRIPPFRIPSPSSTPSRALALAGESVDPFVRLSTLTYSTFLRDRRTTDSKKNLEVHHGPIEKQSGAHARMGGRDDQIIAQQGG